MWVSIILYVLALGVGIFGISVVVMVTSEDDSKHMAKNKKMGEKQS